MCVCRLIKEWVKGDAASLPLLCEEKQRESSANRSGFSNFSSLTLIQKQFSAISWGTICNDTRIPLSLQSETAFPPTCHSKSSSHWRLGLCVSSTCTDTHVPLCIPALHRIGKQDKQKEQQQSIWVMFRVRCILVNLVHMTRFLISVDFVTLCSIRSQRWNSSKTRIKRFASTRGVWTNVRGQI